MSNPEQLQTPDEVFAFLSAQSGTHGFGELEFSHRLVDGLCVTISQADIERHGFEGIAVSVPTDLLGDPTPMGKSVVNHETGLIEASTGSRDLLIFRHPDSDGFMVSSDIRFLGYGYEIESEETTSLDLPHYPAHSTDVRVSDDRPFFSVGELDDDDRMVLDLALRSTPEDLLVSTANITAADCDPEKPAFRGIFEAHDAAISRAINDNIEYGVLTADEMTQMQAEMRTAFQTATARYTFQSIKSASVMLGVDFERMIDPYTENILKPEFRPDQVLPSTIAIHQHRHGSKRSVLLVASKYGFTQRIVMDHDPKSGAVTTLDFRGPVGEGVVRAMMRDTHRLTKVKPI